MDDLELEIKLAELDNRLQGQITSKKSIELKMLKLNYEMRNYKKTLDDLEKEIAKTNTMIKDLRGGEKE